MRHVPDVRNAQKVLSPDRVENLEVDSDVMQQGGEPQLRGVYDSAGPQRARVVVARCRVAFRLA